MKEKTKAYLAGGIILAAAIAAETITVNAQSIMQEEAAGIQVITTVEPEYTDDEVDLISRCVQAEYGNGTEYDKRLVVSVILNRLESDLPDFRKQDSIEKVICAPNQFAVAKYYTIETLNAVYKELRERTDTRIYWFSSCGYLPYGEHIMKVNGHYFTGYKGETE